MTPRSVASSPIFAAGKIDARNRAADHLKPGPPPAPHRPGDWGAILGDFGEAGNDRVPRLIVDGGIGNECGHGQVSAIGQSDNTEVVGPRGDAMARAAGAGLSKVERLKAKVEKERCAHQRERGTGDDGSSRQFAFEPLPPENQIGGQENI